MAEDQPGQATAPARPEAVRWLRIYLAMVKASWATALEYRAQIVIWLLSWLFPLIMMVVWLAVVAEVGPAAGWDQSDFVSYYVAAAIVNYLTVAWIVWDWDDDIRTGTMSIKLLKPVDPFHHYFTNQLGQKLFFAVFLLPVFIVVAWLVPAIHYPLTFARLAAVVLSVILGFGLNMAMGAAAAVLAFWTTQAKNVEMLWTGVGQFLSGWIAPLPLFPAGFQSIARVLPFRSSLGFPIELLMGRLTWPEIAFGFAVTIGWTLFFWAVYRLLWRIGLRRYEAVGA